jgi:hypothetical protein
MKNWMLSIVILMCVLSMALLVACSSLQTQHQRIAAACEGAATAADSIAAGKEAGRVTAAQAKQALEVYRVTVPYCEPEPATSLSSADYAALITAAAQLATLSEKPK